jgi:putative FmdB family regulatory protein
MPIYAYKCSACGHAKDVLQKISDDPLTVCPVCAAVAFSKQVTAAGFQLKGSGWYVSDFRGNGDGANSGVGKAEETAKADAPKADAGTPATAAVTAAPAPAPAASATKSAAPSAASTPASS